MSLNWDRDALDNGDGPATVVAYDDEGNELFWCREAPNEKDWLAFITIFNRISSYRISGKFSDRESAEKICEHFHELAEINHGYS